MKVKPIEATPQLSLEDSKRIIEEVKRIPNKDKIEELKKRAEIRKNYFLQSNLLQM